MESAAECSLSPPGSPPPTKKCRVESMELEPSGASSTETIAAFAESANASLNKAANDAVAAVDFASTTPTTKANKDIYDAANNIIMAAEILHKAAVVIKKIALSESGGRINLPNGRTWTLSEMPGKEAKYEG